MKLRDLEQYNPITIQCHDNPDADAVGSGYGLYLYFKSKGKDVRLVYSGRNPVTKSNLRLMIEKLNIPLEYVEPGEYTEVKGLLITVDCQYGAGNVFSPKAEHVAVIDHHELERAEEENMRVRSDLGSCATLVWRMLHEEGFHVDDNKELSTALYYGLFTDTGQLAELSHPLDRDMAESLQYNKRLITLFRNSNLSLQELEIAGIAMLRYTYNDDYFFSVIKAHPCDPNILGLISDFLLQVEGIETCVVYNENAEGYKFSVRSCVSEVRANEMAAFLANGLGSGGGHVDKAGGFISKIRYEEKYPTMHSEAYFNNRMVEYFDTFEIIWSDKAELDMSGFSAYRRKKDKLCYLYVPDIMSLNSQIAIRTQSDNMDLDEDDDVYIVVEHDGKMRKVYPERFHTVLEDVGERLEEDYFTELEYQPVIKDKTRGSSRSLFECAGMCIPKDTFRIRAKKLDKAVKLFTKWDDVEYMLGMPGDYLVVSEDDPRNIYIERGEGFEDRFLPMDLTKTV